MATDVDTTPGPIEAEMIALCSSVCEPDAAMAARAWARLDSLTKPPRSLGKLEEIAVRLAVIQQTVRPESGPGAIVLVAGDHGVVAEGVSAWPSEVTLQMVANIAAGGAAINQLAEYAGARLVLVDVGVAGDTSGCAAVVQAKVRPGTRNLATEAAMTREEAAAAFMVGARIASELAADGIRVIGTGEMGIGNSTAAAALVAGYTDVPVKRVVGRGTGIDDAALARKKAVIESALRLHRPSTSDPFATLANLGGFEIAAMAGLFVGGAAAGVCVVSDGMISASAALASARICPACIPYVLPSHLSLEPGHHVALVALGLEPFVELDMRLGEGTGAAIAMSIIGSACVVINGMATFAEAGVAEGGHTEAVDL